MLLGSASTELCENIPAKLRESPSKCSAAHRKNVLWRNNSTSHSLNLAEMFLPNFVTKGWY